MSGSDNSVIGNHFSQVVDAQTVRPATAVPVIIRLVERRGNLLSTNHVVSKDVRGTSGADAYSAQVEALLPSDASGDLAVTTVLVDPESAGNTILDSGTEAQVIMDTAANAFRATPAIG